MKKFINFKYIVIVLVIVSLSISLIDAQFNLMIKRQQLANLEKQEERARLETDDIQRLLEIEDKDQYVERIARDRLGYSNPNEKVYRDIQGE